MTIYLVNLLSLLLINGILALTLNFLIGYAGIYSMAQAFFFGVGAYAASFVAIHYSPQFFLCIGFAMLVCALLSLLIALPALRVRGEYFVAASLGIQMIGMTFFSEWKSVTGGIGGLVNIPAPKIFWHTIEGPYEFLGLISVCFLAIAYAFHKLLHGSFGRSLQALRDSESASSAIGKNVTLVKTLAVVTSSALAAIAGALYAFNISFINVESFTLDTSVMIMAMVLIGGSGTFWGPLIGTAVLMALPSLLSFMTFLPSTEIGSIQQIVYGLAMVLLMIYRPGGLFVGPKGNQARAR